ncbi:MAG: hypothetical protein AAB539_03175 [Patescibacteria group bacterium]
MASSTTQQFLAIDAIREDTIILRAGGLRVVLMCSSLNLALKSEDEQDAVTYQYQNFLNSLDFSLQFVVQSRRMNIAPYLATLTEREKEEDNELLKIQIGEYIEFIRTFVSITNIMSKTFYVIVPFIPSGFEEHGFFKKIFSYFGSKDEQSVSADIFEEYKNQLWQRVDAVTAGLRRFGIRAAPLSTEELIELFYGLYNPADFEGGAPIKDKNGE